MPTLRVSSRRPRRHREAQECSRSPLQPKKMLADKPTSRLRQRAIAAAVAKRRQEDAPPPPIGWHLSAPLGSRSSPRSSRPDSWTGIALSLHLVGAVAIRRRRVAPFQPDQDLDQALLAPQEHSVDVLIEAGVGGRLIETIQGFVEAPLVAP
jgi:hypothetical protein